MSDDIRQRIADVLRREFQTKLGISNGQYFPADVFGYLADVLATELEPDIDKVAQAIYEGRGFATTAWAHITEAVKGEYRRMARAAVAAMTAPREDTQAGIREQVAEVLHGTGSTRMWPRGFKDYEDYIADILLARFDMVPKELKAEQ